MKKKFAKLSALLLAASIALSACGQTGGNSGSASNTASAAASKDLTVVLAQIGNNLDTVQANYTDTSIVMFHVYDRLVKVDDNLDVVGDIASNWEQTDNVTVTFTVKDGYKFHNGDALTMDDIVYSIERMNGIARMASFTENLAGIEVNGNVLTVRMNEPDSGFIRSFSEIIIVNKAYCESAGESFANAPIGTGPYTVSEYIPGDKVVLSAWADYPFEKAKIETITFKGISESAAKYIAVESGDAHFASIDANDSERALSNDKLNLLEKITTNTAFVSMNTQAAPFDNVNVRRAIAHAYNKEGIASLAPGRTTIDSMFPNMFATYYSSPNTIKYDLQKAKELLEAEGYNASNPLKFEALIYSSSDAAMEAFQAELRSINVEMNITNMEFGVFLEKMAGADYEFLSGSWNNTSGNPLGAFESYYTGSFGNSNIAFYDNPRCDELYQIAKTTDSQEELIAAAKELQDIAASEVPIIPTISRKAYYAAVKELSGTEILTSGLISFRNAQFN